MCVRERELKKDEMWESKCDWGRERERKKHLERVKSERGWEGGKGVWESEALW